MRGEKGTATTARHTHCCCVGRTLDNRYLLQHFRAAGGMGSVFLGRHLELGKHVAVKVLSHAGRQAPEAIARFYAEARACAALNHPNAVRMIDFGRDDGGLWYLVMEYLEGKSIAEVLDVIPVLPVGTVLCITRQLLAALAGFHALGYLHRDIKPDNVMLTPTGCSTLHVKLIDFGAAAPVREALPREVEFVGTPLYMPPEMLFGTQVANAASDLYSMGLLLHKALTGRLPLRDHELVPMARAKLSGNLALFEGPQPQVVPAAVKSLVRHLLCDVPWGRPQSAHEALELVERVEQDYRSIASDCGHEAELRVSQIVAEDLVTAESPPEGERAPTIRDRSELPDLSALAGTVTDQRCTQLLRQVRRAVSDIKTEVIRCQSPQHDMRH